MKKLIIILMAISMAAGCTTTRTIHSVSDATAERVRPGDTATLEYVDGSSEKVEIRSYGASSLDVASGDATLKTIPYTEIRAIHAKQIDGKKTAGVAVGIVALLGLAAGLDNMAFFPEMAY